LMPMDVLNALADQEQRTPQKGSSSSSSSSKPLRMPGLDRSLPSPAPAVRSLCASLCASGAYADDNMSDARRRELCRHGVGVVTCCLKFGAQAHEAGDTIGMLLWASRASSLADMSLLLSDPIGMCVRVWAMDFKAWALMLTGMHHAAHHVLVQALLMGGVRFPLAEGAAPVVNLHKACVLIVLGRNDAAAAAAETGAKEFQLSIQGISISSSNAQPLADPSPFSPPPPPSSHARLRHALSWIRGKQQQPLAAGGGGEDVGAFAAPSDDLQLLYNTGWG